MARTKKPSARKPIPFGDIQWVMNNLTDKELAQYDALEKDFVSIFADFNRMLEAGWKLSTKFDEKSSAFQATLIAGFQDMENAGFALSARSDDLLDAIGLVWFKFEVLAQADLSEYRVDKSHVRG